MRPWLALVRPNTKIAAVAAAAALWLGAGAVAVIQGACLTAYPPDLPPLPQHRPTILPDEFPAVDVPFGEWPALGFRVDVEIDPGQSFSWAIFEDYDSAAPTSPVLYLLSVTGEPGASVVPLSIPLPVPPDDGLCHRIDFVVAQSFAPDGAPFSGKNAAQFRSPQGLGGDVVTWWYTGGASSTSCTPYGGALPEGGFVVPEASTDSPPPVPE
jgi:hypothetical protein